MQQGVKYTQVVDEKTGKITFVPDSPPEQGEGDGGGGNGQGQNQQSQNPSQSQQQSQGGGSGGGPQGSGEKPEQGEEGEQKDASGAPKRGKRTEFNTKHDIGGGVFWPKHVLDEVRNDREEYEEEYFDFKENAKLNELLTGLEANNKKLRYSKRLQKGKLDGRRLTAYKTSDRLFKQKAIKHKDYQFNILIDTSGSMFYSELMTAMSAVAKTVKAIEQLNMPVAVWSMNYALGLVKDYDETFDDERFKENMLIMSSGVVIDRENQSLSDSEVEQEIAEMQNGQLTLGNTNLRGLNHFTSGTIENVAYEQSLAYSKANSGPKTKPVFIVLSDGEPGGHLSKVPVLMGDTVEYVEMPDTDNDVNSLRRWWEKRATELTAYGIGIYSSCGQVPNSQTINDLEQLPEVMSDLIQQIIF